MIAGARRKHAGESRFRFEVGDAAELPLDAASVDVSFSTLSFHHWTRQAQGLREMARVLRPNGLFVLGDIRPIWLLGPARSSFHDAGASQPAPGRGLAAKSGRDRSRRARRGERVPATAPAAEGMIGAIVCM
jgi:ubiquinone/menaquinone biosynthesis C-methylase UbiE